MAYERWSRKEVALYTNPSKEIFSDVELLVVTWSYTKFLVGGVSQHSFEWTGNKAACSFFKEL